jgi:hypothetical protein
MYVDKPLSGTKAVQAVWWAPVSRPEIAISGTILTLP